MLYIYYMKNKILLFSFLFLFPLLVQAQITVVRIQNGQIYLDTSSTKKPLQKGATFKVILSTEKLINPKTKKDLGILYNYSPEGIITEVQPLYAIGKLPSISGIEIGQEAVVEEMSDPIVSTTSKAVTKEAETISKHKKIVYEPVAQEIISISSADVTSPGADNIITLDTKKEIGVWNRKGEELEKVLSYQLPVRTTPISLSAAPLRRNQTAELFVVVYDNYLARISTLVLAYENGQWNLLETLPYFVKELGCGKDKQIWGQRAFVIADKPGNAHEILFEKNKFTMTGATLNTQHNWLTGLNLFPTKDEQDPSLIYISRHGRINLNLPNGKTTENKDFSVGAPNRVKYKQEIVKFYPSLQVIQSQGRSQIAAVENTAKLGLLSDSFGKYESGKIHFLSFEKGRLSVEDTTVLDGFVYDTACTDTAILSAEVLPDGQSAVVEILK